MTRSTEDLTSRNAEHEDTNCSNNNINSSNNSARNARMNQTESIERSPSCHVNVSRNIIILPKNYNPIAQLSTLESLQTFQAKTFSTTKKHPVEVPENGFTNPVFDDSMKTANNIQALRKTFKQIVGESRVEDLQVVGVLIVEIFLAAKMRAHGSCNKMTLSKRIEVCENLLKNDLRSIPICVQYPLKLLFGMFDGGKDQITDRGLPQPDANQLLEPILSNTLFPFPMQYYKVYAIMKMLYDFKQIGNLLELYTFFECDGKQCQKYETLDKTRIAFNRKISEVKIFACVAMGESLLQPIGNEQFNPVQLLLPHIIDLIHDDETSILAAWYMFDMIATALGPMDSQKYLLEPLLQLYNSNEDVVSDRANSNFKNRKAVKLYHHSFLLKLIVRFGLKCFLENFIPPIIEAVGGYKDNAFQSQPYHHHRDVRQTKARNLKISEADSSTLMSPDDRTDKTMSPSNDQDQDEVFVLDDSNGDEAKNAILKILDHFEIKSESGSLDLKLNYSSAFEVSRISFPPEHQKNCRNIS